MIVVRGGGPSAGYISAGFFGASSSSYLWLVPSLIGGVISVFFVGLILGPIYPATMNHAGRVFPRWWMVCGVCNCGGGRCPLRHGRYCFEDGDQELGAGGGCDASSNAGSLNVGPWQRNWKQ
ncbi:hypothetical protein DFH06DRAFT_1136178 [Mycena polygramma]|nr:hypothetical protein DFH06DRAFT_1136178 [Mycena polygramma]